ncbi:RND transporter [Vitiosangium sp. GDMCC 1.1324]|nr:RND transporter [Vitiosangium sp. GDMCC 1.1324]
MMIHRTSCHDSRNASRLPLLAALMLASCAVGPDYVRPTVAVPEHFKEAAEGWKVAQPSDRKDRGAWWESFHDPELNALEEKVATSNQTVAGFEAAYQRARTLVAQARASFFPTIGVSASARRSRGAAAGGGTSTGSSPPRDDFNVSLDAAWEPDLWGRVRRQVNGANASAQAAADDLANAKLSAQGMLAQSYFRLRALDAAQKLLDDTVAAYQKALELTQNRHAQGVVSRADVLQAQTQLLSAQAAAFDNGIARAQLEHAIAVLVGVPASIFSLPRRPLDATPPEIPAQLPSALLERRPDVAAAERRAAAANEQIGVAMSAFFPSLMLSATTGLESAAFAQWFAAPALVWSLGSQLAAVLFDGGLRAAQTAEARAAYDQSAAAYRQTVLAAFQDVEDNLVSLRMLEKEADIQQQAVRTAHQALEIVTNEYKAGTATYLDVIASQTVAFSAENRLINISSQRMVSAVGLIKALGGGWNEGATRPGK